MKTVNHQMKVIADCVKNNSGGHIYYKGKAANKKHYLKNFKRGTLAVATITGKINLN